MSFGRPPPTTNGAGGKRSVGGGGGGRSKAGASGASVGVAAARPDIQERLLELQNRRDAWMQQRDKPAGPAPNIGVGGQAGPQQHASKAAPQQAAAPNHRGAAPAEAGSSSLLDRVRVELEDIEREVRASAGLPRSAPSAPSAPALSKSMLSSSMGGSGTGSGFSLRPVSHFCPACGRLMLGASMAPQLLAPCGHSVCADCAPRPEEAQPPLRCPHCGLRMAGVRPDAALRAAIEAFKGGAPGGASVSVADSDAAAAAAAGSAAARRWLQQLDVISGRMRQLDSSMEALQSEVAQLTGQLEAEADRDRQLAASEAATRKEISRLQAQLHSLSEQRSVSRDNQAFIQTEIDAKKEAIQGAFASQQLVSQELAKLQRLCAG